MNSGRVTIINGNSLQCDHGLPTATLEDCQECLQESSDLNGNTVGNLKVSNE